MKILNEQNSVENSGTVKAVSEGSESVAFEAKLKGFAKPNTN